MTKLQNRLGLILLVVPFAVAQPPANRPPRIICTPPTMKVLKMVKPTYPPDARNLFGTVAVEVEIDKSGNPSSIKILKGDPLLAAAVMDALKQWRWKPLSLNGKLVPAETTITVNFEPRRPGKK